MAVEERFTRQLMSRTPEERLAMATRMFATAKTLARAGLADGGPMSLAEERALLFLRFYGQDFDEADRARILAHLASV